MSKFQATRLLPMLLVLLVSATPYQAADSQTSDPQGSESNFSELRLDAALIQGFLRVVYFVDGGRFHFREYSECSYEFIQNPSVSVKDGLVHVSAEYFRRRGTGAAGGCLGGPQTNTNVTLLARPFAQGSAVALEILEIKTERMPQLIVSASRSGGRPATDDTYLRPDDGHEPHSPGPAIVRYLIARGSRGTPGGGRRSGAPHRAAGDLVGDACATSPDRFAES